MNLHHYKVRVKYDKSEIEGGGKRYTTAIVWATSEAHARDSVRKWLQTLPHGELVSIVEV